MELLVWSFFGVFCEDQMYVVKVLADEILLLVRQK
jgi:hypothetical protein